MDRAVGYVVNGLIALILSLVVWRLTGNAIGWLLLFAPGAALVILGWVVGLRSRD